MNKIDINTWEEFEISEIFITEKKGNTLQVPTGASIPKRFLLDGDIPRVSAANINNGILGFYKKADCKEYKLFNNFISVSFLGTTFYHNYKASLDMKIHYLQLKNKQLNKYIAFFLISIIRKVISNTEYNDQISSTVLPNLKIKLPVSDPKTPNWEYMENFIKQLETTSEEIACNISDYLNKSEPKKVNTKEWKEFEINTLFIIKRPDTRSAKKHEDGEIPFVSSGSFNNGIDSYKEPFEAETLDKGNCITVSPVDGSTFYQENDFLGRGGGGSSIILLYNDNLNKLNGLFLSTIINKTLKKLYEYNNMGNSKTIKKEKIKLPITAKNEPDWSYMEKFITDIQNDYSKLKDIL